MRWIVTLSALAALGVALACDEAPESGPAALQVQPAAEDLIDLLPGSTLAAVELRDVASRWDELRAIPALRRLQDRMLAELGLDDDDVPEIAGSRTVVAFVPDYASRRIVPLLVLDPPSPTDALARLARSERLVAIEARGAIWAGFATQAPKLERVAAGDGTSLRQAVDLTALAERLPAGGLVRAVLNPRALREHLLRWAKHAGAKLAGKLAALLAGDLEAVEVAGFRRDVVDGQLLTDAWLGIDAEAVPAAFRRALATHRGPAVLPSALSEDVIAAKSFRSEPEAGLAWLRTRAARDPSGPLRNLEFWIDEFEARSGRDVETDIVAALGERGLALLLEGEGAGSLELVTILDARDPARLEAALVDLRDWLAEQIQGRSLGLATPKNWDAGDESGVAHGLAFWTPLRTLSGPVFQIAGDRLVVATSRRALSYGVTLAGSAATWRTPAWALAGGPPDEIALIRTSAVARLLDGGSTSARDGRWLGEILDFLAGVGEGRVGVHYEENGFRISAQIDLDAPVTSTAASER